MMMTGFRELFIDTNVLIFATNSVSPWHLAATESLQIVEEYEPGVFEVEFSDLDGHAYAIETLNANQLMVLYHQPMGEKTLV